MIQLADFFTPDLIKLNVDVQTKYQAILMLIDDIYEKYEFTISKAEIVKRILDREKINTTSLSSGLAIPHGRLENHNHTIIAVAVLKKPVYEQDIAVRWITLILTSDKSAVLYLNIVKSLVELSQDTSFTNLLYSASDPNQIISFIKAKNLSMQYKLTVENIMTTTIYSVTKDTTLDELGNLFYNYGFNYCPIVDCDNSLIGEINMLDLMKKTLPDIDYCRENFDQLAVIEPDTSVLKKSSGNTVESIMRSAEFTLPPNASIAEAIFMLVNNRRRDIPVIKDKKIVGILSYTDVFRKLIKD